jgi:ParB/RepB/Spo0J family partition protein
MPSPKGKGGHAHQPDKVEPTKAEPSKDFPSAKGAHAPEHIDPGRIRPNPKNPRRKFPPKRIEALADSLNEVGMLVPLTVFQEKGDDADYTLLDGERRLRAAKLTNWPTVPAWITEKPKDSAQNTLRMFNIHLMRDEWGDMPTALALKDIMDQTGVQDEKELSKMTGLGRDTVRNMKRVLEFPQEWQDRVLNEEIPFNLLVELDKAILKKKQDPKKEDVLASFSEKKLRDFFLKGYEKGLVTDVVDLRNVGSLIDTAASQKNSDRVRKRAKDALETLLKGNATIEEAYQYGAAASIGIKQVLRDVDNLPGRLNDVLASEIDDDDRDRLLVALRKLRDEIGKVIKRLS